MSQKQLESAYRGVLDRRMLEQLDEAWDIACENRNHCTNGGVLGPHGGPAKFWLAGPCELSNGFRCAPIAEYAHGQAEVGEDYKCNYCGQRHMWAENIFTPIGGAS